MERKINTVFAHFTQNNSGGYFLINEEKGIGHHIIVEGLDINDVRRRVEEITEDFSENCSCCGERWDTLIWQDELTSSPNIYMKPIQEYLNETNLYIKDIYVFVHYIDGTIEKYHKHTESGTL